MEQLEEKINTELVMLKEKIATMEKELEVYSDLSTLKEEAEKKRRVGLGSHVGGYLIQEFMHLMSIALKKIVYSRTY